LFELTVLRPRSNPRETGKSSSRPVRLKTLLRPRSTAQGRIKPAQGFIRPRSQPHRFRASSQQSEKCIPTSELPTRWPPPPATCAKTAAASACRLPARSRDRQAPGSPAPWDERRKIEGIGGPAAARPEIVVAAPWSITLLDRLHLKGFRYSPLGLRDRPFGAEAAER